MDSKEMQTRLDRLDNMSVYMGNEIQHIKDELSKNSADTTQEYRAALEWIRDNSKDKDATDHARDALEKGEC